MWKETFQLYNGGHFWIWEADVDDEPEGPGKWVQNPGLVIHPGHSDPAGAERWDLLLEVRQGNFPAGW